MASLIRWIIRSTELLRFFSGIDSRPPCAVSSAHYDASQATRGAGARSNSERSTVDATAPSTASERQGERSPQRTDPCRVAPWTEPRRSGLGLVAALGAGHGYRYGRYEGGYEGEYSPRANGRSEAFGEDDEGCEPLIGGKQAQSSGSSTGVIIGGGR